MAFWTYILASRRNGTLYIGSTDDLLRRVNEHRNHLRPGFTQRYKVTQLVWHAMHRSRELAFAQERQLKHWNRTWKIELIERTNPGWRDLYEDMISQPLPEWVNNTHVAITATRETLLEDKQLPWGLVRALAEGRGGG